MGKQAHRARSLRSPLKLKANPYVWTLIQVISGGGGEGNKITQEGRLLSMHRSSILIHGLIDRLIQKSIMSTMSIMSTAPLRI